MAKQRLPSILMLGADFAGAAPSFLYIDIGHNNMQGGVTGFILTFTLG
jgi:hypothetical protein